MAPPTVRLLLVTVTVGLTLRVTAPLPRFRSLGPTNAKFPLQVWTLLLSVRALPEVLPMLPPEMVRRPLPRAWALPISSSPAESVVPPL